jgi:hypothetical protein
MPHTPQALDAEVVDLGECQQRLTGQD